MSLHRHVLIVFLPNQSIANVLVKLATGDLNSWVIQELLLADLVITQYTSNDEGPY